MSKYKKTVFDAIIENDILRTSIFLRKIKNLDTLYRYRLNPLHTACQYNHMDIVDILLQAGMDVNHKIAETGYTSLMLAIQNKNTSMVRLLLDHNTNIHATDSEGKTALMHAIRLANIEIAQLLIDLGADLEHKDNFGNTSVMCALTDSRYIGITFNLLLPLRVNLNLRYRTGETLITYAYSRGHISAMHMLLNAGAHIDMQDIEGKTLLMRAAVNNDSDLIKYLLDRGADPTITDNAGKTFMDAVSMWYNGVG